MSKFVTRGRREAMLIATAMGLVAGCAENGSRVEFGQTVVGIAAEIPGVADMISRDDGCPGSWCGYRQNSTVTLASYTHGQAAGSAGTAAWISPNIFMTAAHVDPQGITQMKHRIHFLGQQHPTDVFVDGCSYVFQSLQPETDVTYTGSTDSQFVWCPDVSIGNGRTIPPGVLFGYHDYDLSPVVPGSGEQLAKVWWNIVVAEGPPGLAPEYLLYGSSVPVSTQPFGWQAASIIGTDACTNEGASGSPWFRLSDMKLRVGPQSTGNGGDWRGSCYPFDNNAFNDAGGPDSGASSNDGGLGLPTSNGVSMAQVVRVTSLRDSVYPTHINDSTVNAISSAIGASPALLPASYDGLLDKDADDVIDLQRDIDRFKRETVRPAYWLGFESLRRIRTWIRPAWSGIGTFSADTATYRATTSGSLSASTTVLQHEGVWLRPSTNYRVSLRTHTLSSASSPSATIRFDFGTGSPAFVSLPASPTAANTPVSARITTPASGGNLLTVLRVQLSGNIDISLRELVIFEESSPLDFDTYDSRRNWNNDAAGGSRAFIVPWGRPGVAGRPAFYFGNWSFAGLVVRSGTPDADGYTYTLRNRELGLRSGFAYNICFSHNRSTAAFAPSLRAMVRNQATGVTIASTTVTPTNGWSNTCFATPVLSTNDVSLRFGVTSTGNPFGDARVDDITITQL